MWQFCKVLMYIILTFLGLLGLTFALCVAYVTCVVFLPTYFPTPIHKFSRTWDIETAMELNDPNIKLSKWGLRYDGECGKVRMIFLDMDCMGPAEKCQKKIGEFEKGYKKMKQNEKEEKFANVSHHCFEAAACMRGMACKEATYQYKLFYKIPHNFYMNYSKLPICMTKFYGAVRDGSLENCTSSYDFLSKDPFTKNQAYSSGKFCLLSFARQYCDPLVFGYLGNYYDVFLELATIPSQENCGIFEAFEALECQRSIEMFEKSVKFLKNGNRTQTDYADVGQACDQMQYCFGNLTNSCAISSELQVKTKEYCEKMHFFASPFWQCVEQLKHENFQPDLLKYPCFISHQFNDDSDACRRMTDSADCVKKIMVEQCGRDILDGYEDSRNYLLEMWDC
ncbi:unnamed protein product [Caenorhabditis brenneri]